MTLPKSIHLRFVLFSAAIAVLIVILNFLLPQVIHEKIWEIYFFMVITSFLIGLLNGFLLKSFAENFFQIMVLAMILRFIASLVFIGLEVWPGMANIILFIADFFMIFLFYLVFDIYTFLANLRPISK
ncbi:MAG: hypothetical protein Q8S14_01140 [Algoriphagus sp.]|uniref:hypothetical protein n=1 Tax=Algoriphagus sp. TaxID=1872435 RepID=UPI002724879F|nr:hypothetical protein [Algoriphagus sp.]MDO8968504.1 hypothetical protein [Algoriphagus sp.]MDP2043426.1 hypothetical protein [Algoriphagus sp.]MDP3200719.1 hypothetical protein [Algoriphagus sp.]MDP3470448.1 hypothetical protein [Algoriphagus sp.]